MICNFEERIYNTQVPCTFANILISHKTRALDKALFSVNGNRLNFAFTSMGSFLADFKKGAYVAVFFIFSFLTRGDPTRICAERISEVRGGGGCSSSIFLLHFTTKRRQMWLLCRLQTSLRR